MIQLSEHFTLKEAICHDLNDPSKPCPFCLGIYIYNEKLLQALEQFRSIVNAPVEITSWIRCFEKEKRMKPTTVAPRSQHNLGKAVDVIVENMGARDLYKIAMEVEAFKNGGIGVYVQQDSKHDRIHLDVRCYGPSRWGVIGNGVEGDIEKALVLSL
jgi:hypothetical protein